STRLSSRGSPLEDTRMEPRAPLVCTFTLLLAVAAPWIDSPRALAQLPVSSVGDPVQYYARLGEAGKLFAQRKYEQALPIYAELPGVTPSDAGLALRAGQGCVELKRTAEAIPWYERAFAGGAFARYELAYTLAQLCARESRADTALDWLAKALELRYVQRAD